QDPVRVIATRGEGDGARFARPQLGTGLLLEHAQPARVVGMWLRVQKHLDVLDAEAELRDARHDQRRGGGITAIEHDVALGPGDEEGGGVGRPHVVQVAGDAERFGRPLPASLVRVQPPTDKYQCNNSRDCQQDYEPKSFGKTGHPQSPSNLTPGFTASPPTDNAWRFIDDTCDYRLALVAARRRPVDRGGRRLPMPP